MIETTNQTALGVSRSAAGQVWKFRPSDDRLVLAMCQRHGLPDILARLLVARGVTLEDVPNYLEPRLRDLLPDPSCLTDMDKAAERLALAVERDEKIAVFGDYDVDGATSSAVLSRYFGALGKQLRVYIPDRQKEGYGPNIDAFRQLQDEGHNLIVTVDCGTMAHKTLGAAHVAGIDVIVADHHQTGGGLPTCFALVNPRRADDTSGLGHLAAVGVTFLLVIAVNRALRRSGYFDTRDEPDVLGLLDMVALGTVCDVVPLQGLNRALVRQGLTVAAQTSNEGIRALARVSRAAAQMGTYEFGFQLGPRLNAGGRVGEASLGVRLLSTESSEEASGFAMRLDDLNTERRAIEAGVLSEAMHDAENKIAAHNASPPYFLTAREGWHPGVIGIVAGRIKDKFHRPSFVIALDETGLGKGSARSISGIDVGRLIAGAVDRGLIEAGGGHAMAAGLTLRADQMAGFEAYLTEELGGLALDGPRDLWLDASLSPAAANTDLLELINKAGPFGAGNAEPRLVFPAVRVVQSDIVGDGHVRCILAGREGGRLKAIAFSSVPEDVRALLTKPPSLCHIAGFLRADNWNGRHDVQLMVHDAAYADSA
ncbi:MAG: single-stranded-DNA-specific exonuclease RecJ [Rhizobiales bacterium TMED83]|jgi:single-stranded-DNA-specific exonuclease|nr:single-stranded-DNA-specific exonuclease RecJ [Rhodobiaceae bacterium]RPF94630.1 MAG: single-stranded-DNA-specific exonuclease RecJ [Rhizobiales bacterium TMED83]